jgi:hypothetical protein
MQPCLESVRPLVTKKLSHAVQPLIAMDQTVKRVPAPGALLEMLLQADRLGR